MSHGATLLVDYQRSGGRPPADDERLAIEADGRFTGRRTVGGPRAGTFEGRLADADLAAVTRLAAAAAEAGDLQVPTPADGATEWIKVSGHEARMGSNERPSGPWGELVEALRRLLKHQLVESPIAAIELQVTEGSTRLALVGQGTLEIDPASVSTRTVRLGDDGAVLGRGSGAARSTGPEDSGSRRQPEWVAPGPGWSQGVDVGAPLELAPGDWLQTWVSFRIREHGITRDARLFVARQA